MKKKLLLLAVAVVTLLSLAGCGNRQTWDTVHTFDEVQIKMPDGTYISGKVDSWRDYDDSDQLQVTVNGYTYLTGAENIVLIAKEKK